MQPGVPKKHPTEYLKQLYYDSIVFTPEALRHLVGRSRREPDRDGHRLSVSVGRAPVDHVLDTPGLSDADRDAILGGTATTLLGLPKS